MQNEFPVPLLLKALTAWRKARKVVPAERLEELPLLAGEMFISESVASWQRHFPRDATPVASMT
jgi:hypothetical protein